MTDTEIMNDDSVEKIDVTRIVKAADGQIPYEELTETEHMLTKFYLWVYEKAWNDIMLQCQQIGDGLFDEVMSAEEAITSPEEQETCSEVEEEKDSVKEGTGVV